MQHSVLPAYPADLKRTSLSHCSYLSCYVLVLLLNVNALYILQGLVLHCLVALDGPIVPPSLTL